MYLCVCVCVIEYCLYGSLVSDSEIWLLFVRPFRGVPINCPNVQTSFVMRITKIEANHFANRILISNVSDGADIRCGEWVAGEWLRTVRARPPLRNLC